MSARPRAPRLKRRIGAPKRVLAGIHALLGLPVMAATGKRVREVYELVYKRFVEHGIDCYVGMFGMDHRAIVMVEDIIYNKNDRDMTDRSRKLFQTLCNDAAKIGVGLYRAHISFMDDAAQMQTFNDHAFGRLNKTLKAALDPSGILAPGKQGIWPERFKNRDA